jgi:hypothetical protein
VPIAPSNLPNSFHSDNPHGDSRNNYYAESKDSAEMMGCYRASNEHTSRHSQQ